MIVHIGPAKGPSCIVLNSKMKESAVYAWRHLEDSLLHSFPELYLRRFHDCFVNCFCTGRNIFPVIKCPNPFMSFQRIMLPCSNDVYCFRYRPHNIWYSK